MDLRGGLAHVTCPVLVTAGELDPICPLDAVRELAEALPPAPSTSSRWPARRTWKQLPTTSQPSCVTSSSTSRDGGSDADRTANTDDHAALGASAIRRSVTLWRGDIPVLDGHQPKERLGLKPHDSARSDRALGRRVPGPAHQEPDATLGRLPDLPPIAPYPPAARGSHGEGGTWPSMVAPLGRSVPVPTQRTLTDADGASR